MKLSRILRILWNCWGIGSIISSISVTLYMLVSIWTEGYFLAGHTFLPSRIFLLVEIASTIYALVYFIYLIKEVTK